MAMQRPGRPSTRLNQPAVNVPAPKPAARPATGAVPRQQAPAPGTGRARSSGSSTRSVAKQSGSRPVPKQAAKSNSTMMIAIGGGVVVVLGIVAFAMSGGGHEKPETTVKKEASKPKAVDVRGLENEGLGKCNEGLALIQKHQSLLSSGAMSDSQKSMLKSDLEKSRKLIGEGMGLLTQANEKSNNTYDTKQYQEALITVRKKLMELRD